MATNVIMSVKLVPVGEPWVGVRAPGTNEYGRLVSPTVFDIEFDTDLDVETLEIEHACKSDTDPITAVIVDSISFFGITDPKFAWQGVYTPVYPELWASQQPLPLAKSILGQTYLGWNGLYQLTFDIPVFTWIHRVQNLGWIYQ